MPALKSIPIFINCRDRLEPLVALLKYLEEAGYEQIRLLDNDSAYPPLLEYFAGTPHRVIRLGRNVGRLALWDAGLLTELNVTGMFVFTDPDIVPDPACPPDAIEYFAEILGFYEDRAKVGFGLRIDDMPDKYKFKKEVILWESQFWERPLGPRLYDAPIDTTFALYRGLELDRYSRSAEFFKRAIRTGYPYVARHTPWYVDDNAISDDEAFYRRRAQGDDVNHWGLPTLPNWLAEAVTAREIRPDSTADEARSAARFSERLRRAYPRLGRRRP